MVVVDDRVGCAFLVLGVRGDDAFGTEGSHVQPHGGGAGASVVGEDDGT